MGPKSLVVCFRGVAQHGGGVDEVERAPLVVVATGVEWRKLALPGIERYLGKGVYYGAARSDAGLARGRDICIVGAGNSGCDIAVEAGVNKALVFYYFENKANLLQRVLAQYYQAHRQVLSPPPTGASVREQMRQRPGLHAG